MPYATVDDIPQAVKDRVKNPKKRRQWLHVWNSVFSQYSDESRAFAAANSVVKKAAGASKMDQDFNFFLPLAKVDKEKQTVSGYASTTSVDSEGEIVSQDALKTAWPDYWKWANIREMHQPKAVGTAEEFNFDEKGLYLTAKIVDKDAWQKIEAGVYKGFSIGGRKLARQGNVITKVSLAEISVCDRPANPECSFVVNKSAGPEGSAFLLPENSDDISNSPPEKEPDNDYDDASEVASAVHGESDGTDSRQRKKMKKKMKKQAKSASPSSSPARDADDGAEAVLGKIESSHELNLETGSKSQLLREEDSSISLSKRSYRKEKVMSEKLGFSELAKAVAVQLLAGTAANPTLALLKAAEDEMKDMKDHRKEAEDVVKGLFDLHKHGLEEQAKLVKAGTVKVGDGFDHAGALTSLKKAFNSLRAMKGIAKSARGNLSKAAGRISGEGVAERGVSGTYEVPTGITTISPGEMDNLPAAKAAGFVTKEHAETLAKLAASEAEAALLKLMPAGPVHGARPYAFDMNKLAGGDNKTSSVLLKDVNPADLSSIDQPTREGAISKVVGNMILGGTGKSPFDSDFRGSAGVGGQA